jgi:hypothetical protein
MPPESDLAGDVDGVPAALAGELEHLRSRPATYAGKARAEATKKAYSTDWAEFSSWAQHKGGSKDALKLADATRAAMLQWDRSKTHDDRHGGSSFWPEGQGAARQEWRGTVDHVPGAPEPARPVCGA